MLILNFLHQMQCNPSSTVTEAQLPLSEEEFHSNIPEQFCSSISTLLALDVEEQKQRKTHNVQATYVNLELYGNMFTEHTLFYMCMAISFNP